MDRRLAVSALTVAMTLGTAHAVGAAPVASFTYSPAAPFTGQVVTFTSTSTGGGSVAWDLDGDGACDDANGAVARRSFATAGSYSVRICLNTDEAIQKQTVTVRNRPPIAAFRFSPDEPVTGEPVTFTSTSLDPDGPLVAQAWDLDADRVFDDGLGLAVTRLWRTPGTYPVALRVLDRDGAARGALRWVRVRQRPPELLSPFPVVRLTLRLTRRGARITYFAVSAPRGARVTVRCRGRGCPYRRRRKEARGDWTRFRSLQRRLVAGAVIRVFVTKPGTIGKYTRFRIRRRRPPTRVDRCLRPGRRSPIRCPHL
jgi:hypothetical protein